MNKPDWLRKEQQESADELAKQIIMMLYENHIIDDEKLEEAVGYAEIKISDAIYAHDEENRIAVAMCLTTAATNAMKGANI